jgi:hypothetical protein
MMRGFFALALAVAGWVGLGLLSNHPGPGKGLPAFGDKVAFKGKYIITATPPSE